LLNETRSALRSDPEVQAALEKSSEGQSGEESYKETKAHFTLRYNGSAEPALAREVLRTLEVALQRESNPS